MCLFFCVEQAMWVRISIGDIRNTGLDLCPPTVSEGVTTNSLPPTWNLTGCQLERDPMGSMEPVDLCERWSRSPRLNGENFLGMRSGIGKGAWGGGVVFCCVTFTLYTVPSLEMIVVCPETIPRELRGRNFKPVARGTRRKGFLM